MSQNCILWISIYTCLVLPPPPYSNAFLASQLVLQKGSRVYDAWAVDPVTTTFSVYLFNYTNVERFEKGIDQKLRLQEVGPYSYTVTSTKENIVFNENGTVTYQERKIYHFAEQISNGSPTDIIIVPNIPYLTGLSDARKEPLMVRFMLDKLMSSLAQEKVFYKIRVEQLLWGYRDNLLQMAGLNPKYALKLIAHFPQSRFGLFLKMNGTQPNVITIHTGEADISKKGILDKYNGKSSLLHWKTTQCNSLDAYPGTALPPHLNKTIHLYSLEACRRVAMELQSSSEVHGVPTDTYHLPPDAFSNSGHNQCYCNDRCPPDGVFDISSCAFGGPILLSKPHFLHGVSVLSKLFEGLSPDESVHKSYLSIEQNLGVIMDGRTTAQLNVMLRRGFTMNSRYPDRLILPVSWVSIKMDELPLEIVWEIQGALQLYKISETIWNYGLPVASTLGGLAFMFL